MNHLKATRFLVFILLIMFIAAGLLIATAGPANSAVNNKIQVVAAENFWGSLISQLGGNKVHVISIVSDPNADPHEYEVNNYDARAFSNANYVILNGAGYDSWGNKLLSSSPSSSRKVLNIADLLGKTEGDNPHFWYSPEYVNKAVKAMETNLISIDPKDSSYYKQQYTNLVSSLSVYQGRIKSIKKQFGGVKVASTESIFEYLASAAGLNLISPPAFIDAVAEGNDPPAASVVEFQNQLNSSNPSVLVYNEQTVTPLTTSMKALAADNNIPIVGVTETIQPQDTSFQVWMNAELINLTNALNQGSLGK